MYEICDSRHGAVVTNKFEHFVWLIGIPEPVLLILFFLGGCT